MDFNHGKRFDIVDEDKEPDFKIENKCQAFLLVVIGALMFTLQVVALATTDSWVMIKTGLRKVSGNLPTGSDEFTGTYPSVEICHAIADVSNVGGFVWVPVAGSPNQVSCEFKTVGTPLESQSVANRTAVIKGLAGASCGMFKCSKTPFPKTIDFYDCSTLQKTIRAFQGFGIMAVVTTGTHFLIQFFMWTEAWGKSLGHAVHGALPMSYGIQAVFLSITWASMVAAYAFRFCGRRVRTVASLNYGIYFLIANTVLCYLCHVLTASAFKKTKPPPVVRPDISRNNEHRRSSFVGGGRKSTTAGLVKTASNVRSINSAYL